MSPPPAVGLPRGEGRESALPGGGVGDRRFGVGKRPVAAESGAKRRSKGGVGPIGTAVGAPDEGAGGPLGAQERIFAPNPVEGAEGEELVVGVGREKRDGLETVGSSRPGEWGVGECDPVRGKRGARRFRGHPDEGRGGVGGKCRQEAAKRRVGVAEEGDVAVAVERQGEAMGPKRGRGGGAARAGGVAASGGDARLGRVA